MHVCMHSACMHGLHARMYTAQTNHTKFLKCIQYINDIDGTRTSACVGGSGFGASVTGCATRMTKNR